HDEARQPSAVAWIVASSVAKVTLTADCAGFCQYFQVRFQTGWIVNANLGDWAATVSSAGDRGPVDLHVSEFNGQMEAIQVSPFYATGRVRRRFITALYLCLTREPNARR